MAFEDQDYTLEKKSFLGYPVGECHNKSFKITLNFAKALEGKGNQECKTYPVDTLVEYAWEKLEGESKPRLDTVAFEGESKPRFDTVNYGDLLKEALTKTLFLMAQNQRNFDERRLLDVFKGDDIRRRLALAMVREQLERSVLVCPGVEGAQREVTATDSAVEYAVAPKAKAEVQGEGRPLQREPFKAEFKFNKDKLVATGKSARADILVETLTPISKARAGVRQLVKYVMDKASESEACLPDTALAEILNSRLVDAYARDWKHKLKLHDDGWEKKFKKDVKKAADAAALVEGAMTFTRELLEGVFKKSFPLQQFLALTTVDQQLWEDMKNDWSLHCWLHAKTKTETDDDGHVQAVTLTLPERSVGNFTARFDLVEGAEAAEGGGAARPELMAQWELKSREGGEEAAETGSATAELQQNGEWEVKGAVTQLGEVARDAAKCQLPSGNSGSTSSGKSGSSGKKEHRMNSITKAGKRKPKN